MRMVDVERVGNIIAEVAALEIMPRFRKLRHEDITIKKDKSSVTIADKAAEKALILSLQKYLPGSVCVGEEGYALNPSIFKRFDGEDPVWVLDPIDGTRNFIDGHAEFAVMVALVQAKKTIAAWIHDPNTGDMLAAEKGSQVWLNGQKMYLAGQDPSTPQLGVVGSRLRKNLSQSEGMRLSAALPPMVLGSAAAYDYARLFTGAKHFANSQEPRLTFLLHRLFTKPWDHLPGLFFLAESHGYAADLNGNDYDVQAGQHGLLATFSKDEWIRLTQALKPVFDKP